MPGVLIAFEGLDGSGKTTALRSVASLLEARGTPILTTREPGGTELGRRIRTLVLESTETVQPETELLLMCADRSEHVRTLIRPALEKGFVVLTDRFAASTIVYQGFGRGLDTDDIAQVLAVATGGLQPDLTLLFDVSNEVAHQRRSSDTSNINHLDGLAADVRTRMRDGYLHLSDTERNWTVIDASGSPDEVASLALQAILSVIERMSAQ